MTFAGINFLAVAIAAVVAWLASACWYMSLGKIYQAAQGKTPEQCKEEMKKPGAFLPFLYAFIGNLVIAWMLAGVLGHLGQVTLKNGVISARSCGSASSSPPWWSISASPAATSACC